MARPRARSLLTTGRALALALAVVAVLAVALGVASPAGPATSAVGRLFFPASAPASVTSPDPAASATTGRTAPVDSRWAPTGLRVEATAVVGPRVGLPDPPPSSSAVPPPLALIATAAGYAVHHRRHTPAPVAGGGHLRSRAPPAST
jgi:hypothetical protein